MCLKEWVLAHMLIGLFTNGKAGILSLGVRLGLGIQRGGHAPATASASLHAFALGKGEGDR
jgi:hypothetical protein